MSMPARFRRSIAADAFVALALALATVVVVAVLFGVR
jgi:hypothetical protein